MNPSKLYIRFVFAAAASIIAISCRDDEPEPIEEVKAAYVPLPKTTPEQTLIAYYDAVNRSDSVVAQQLSSEERVATMRLFLWPVLMRMVGDGRRFRVESPTAEAYYYDSSYCTVTYDRVEYDLKRDSTLAIRRGYSVDAFIEDGQWVLHSGSDNPFPSMLDENPALRESFGLR